MKEVSTRPMAQRRILYVIAVKCAGVTVKLYTSTSLEEFGRGMGCERRKEKARLFLLCQSTKADLEGCTLGQTQPGEQPCNQRPLPRLNLPLSAVHYETILALAHWNVSTTAQGMLTTAVSSCRSSTRRLHALAPHSTFIRLVLKKIRVMWYMTIQGTPPLDQLLDPTRRFHQMTSIQGSR